MRTPPCEREFIEGTDLVRALEAVDQSADGDICDDPWPDLANNIFDGFNACFETVGG